MIGIKKGLFGKGMQPGSMMPAYSMPQSATMQDGANLGAPGEQPKQGMDWKSVLLQTLGGAADGAAVHFGGQPLIAQARQFQQVQAARIAEEQRQRAAGLADYRTKLGIQQEFAGPPKMDDFDTAMARAGIAQGTPEYANLAREYALRKAQGSDETVVVPIPGRGTFVGPRSALQTALGGASQGAPVPQSDWDSAKPMGGGSGNATGGFPRP